MANTTAGVAGIGGRIDGLRFAGAATAGCDALDALGAADTATVEPADGAMPALGAVIGWLAATGRIAGSVGAGAEGQTALADVAKRLLVELDWDSAPVSNQSKSPPTTEAVTLSQMRRSPWSLCCDSFSPIPVSPLDGASAECCSGSRRLDDAA